MSLYHWLRRNSRWFDHLSTKGYVMRLGDTHAERRGTTADVVAIEATRILAPAVSGGDVMDALARLIHNYAYASKEAVFAPALLACALKQVVDHPSPRISRSEVGFGLLDLVAPSTGKDAALSQGAAAVLACMVHLEPTALASRRFVAQLREYSRASLGEYDDYVWMTLEEVAVALNLEDRA